MTGARDSTRARGASWEDVALDYLQRHGLQLITRNFTCRYGEIDLILRDRDTLVFAEVRFRGRSAQGDGTQSVGPAKRLRLTRAASIYLQAHPHCAHWPCRFDVVGCSGTAAAPVLQWTRAAFDAF